MPHYFIMHLMLLSLLLFAGCATNPVTGEREFVLMSEQQEINLGKSYHGEILKEYGVYEDDELQSYVQKIGEQLAALSHNSELIYRFTVLDSPVVNAFALPGGYIYISRGMLAYLNSEAELAGVLGHEIGHVTARHAVQRHTQATTANILSTVILVKTGSRTQADLFNLFGGALISGYGREQELQSDQLGAQYLARTGYDPQQMLKVIGILKNQETFEIERAKQEGREPRSYHGLFATHPENDKRLQEVIAAAKQYQVERPRNSNRDVYLQKIDGMIFGQSEKQGITREGIFYHPELDFTLRLPSHWRVENLADRLLLSDRENDAIMQLTLDDLNKRTSAETYLKELVGKHEPDSATALQINNLEAYTLTATKRYEFGSRATRFIVVFKDKRAYLFVGLSRKGDDLKKFDQTFLSTAKSFHKMTEAERKIGIPYRLRIKNVPPNINYAALAQQSPLPNYAEAQLRLLNHHYPKGEPAAGEKIKIIE